MADSQTAKAIPAMDRYQKLTAAVIVGVIFCVIVMGLDVAAIAMVDTDKIFVAHLVLTFLSIAFTSILAFAGFIGIFFQKP